MSYGSDLSNIDVNIISLMDFLDLEDEQKNKIINDTLMNFCNSMGLQNSNVKN